MRWSKTVASECRWSEAAEINWGDWNIIWEDSEANYQGHATFLAEKDGKYVFYEWWYGSCSGCDPWEDEYNTYGDSPEAVAGRAALAAHMNSQAAHFASRVELENWLNMLQGTSPIGNPGAGGLVNYIDTLSGSLRGRIDAIRAHLEMPPFDWDAYLRRQNND